MSNQRDPFPATDFLTEVFRASPERLRSMNPAKTSQHYGLPEPWVRFCRDRELQTRGGL